MFKIDRHTNCIFAYDESEKRGIVFPARDFRQTPSAIEINFSQRKELLKKEGEDFLDEVFQIAQDMPCGIRINILTYDEEYEVNYKPMKKFLENMGRGAEIFEDDAIVEELFKFFFKHSILQLCPGESPSYVFVG